MAVITSQVSESNDIQQAALNLTAKAFELRQTIAGVWDLGSSDSAPAESAVCLDMTNPSGESVVHVEDGRKPVPEKDFLPGGKYRSIVKLFIHYEFQPPGGWAMGTGWLIKDDLLVTAGHCSYDWKYKWGRATEVKAYIGYKGKKSVSDRNVQFRSVKRIVTTEGWLKAKGAKNFDVSFMQVDKPFTGITPFKFEETPATGDEVLGVVGYPGDLKDQGEGGALMYEMFLQTEWDLSTAENTMLEYQIDTFGGNSGSPVLRQKSLSSIGAHVYGANGGSYNSASVIGKLGNPYNDYMAAIGLKLENKGLNLVPIVAPNRDAVTAPPPIRHSGGFVPDGTVYKQGASSFNPGDATPVGSLGKTRTTTRISTPRQVTRKADNPNAGEESFVDILESALRFGGPVVGGVLSVVGGPVGAAAAVALNAASKLAESANAGESFDGSSPYEGLVESAVINEACLQAIQTMNLAPDEQESIFSDMKDYIVKALPTMKKAAPPIIGAMMEPALRIALDSLHKYNEKVTSGAESFGDEEPFRPQIKYTHNIDRPVDDPKREAFLKGLHNSLSSGSESLGGPESEEAFLDILQAGLRTGWQVAKVGLPILAQVISGTGGAESFDTPADPVPTAPAGPVNFSRRDLANRALVAEAASYALMKRPADKLQEEGFFDTIMDGVKQLAPVVLKFAPDVIKVVAPVVGNLLGGGGKQESATIRRKPSRAVMNNGFTSNMGGGTFLDKATNFETQSRGSGEAFTSNSNRHHTLLR